MQNNTVVILQMTLQCQNFKQLYFKNLLHKAPLVIKNKSGILKISWHKL